MGDCMNVMWQWHKEGLWTYLINFWLDIVINSWGLIILWVVSGPGFQGLWWLRDLGYLLNLSCSWFWFAAISTAVLLCQSVRMTYDLILKFWLPPRSLSWPTMRGRAPPGETLPIFFLSLGFRVH